MPLNGLLAIGSGLLGGYAQGQRLRQEFDKEKEELGFKKKELEVREGLLRRQVEKDAEETKLKLSEVILGPEGDPIFKHGGGVAGVSQQRSIKDVLTDIRDVYGGGKSVFPVLPKGSTGPFPAPSEAVDLSSLPRGLELNLPMGRRGSIRLKNPTATESQQLGEWAIALQRSGWTPGQPITQSLIDKAATWRLEQAQGRGIGERSVLMRTVIQKYGGLTEEALREYESKLGEIREAEARGTVAGGFTGASREAKAATAEVVAEAGAAGDVAGKLRPVPVPGVAGRPPTAETLPGAAAVTAVQQEAKNITETLQGADRAKYQMFTSAERQANIVKGLYRPDFVGKGFAAFKTGFQAEFDKQATAARADRYVPGGLAGGIREFFGNISPEEVKFRRSIVDIADTILRARSGAQINEEEFQRMIGMLFKVTDEPAVFVPAVERFIQEVRNMKADIARLASTPAARLGEPPAPGTTKFPVQDPNRPRILDIKPRAPR